MRFGDRVASKQLPFDRALRRNRKARRDAIPVEPRAFIRREDAVRGALQRRDFVRAENHVIEVRARVNAGRTQCGRHRVVARDGVRFVVFVVEDGLRPDGARELREL